MGVVAWIENPEAPLRIMLYQDYEYKMKEFDGIIFNPLFENKVWGQIHPRKRNKC